MRILRGAKALYDLNENAGGVTSIASRSKIDTEIVNALYSLEVGKAWRDVTLDISSAAIDLTLTAAKTATGNVKNALDELVSTVFSVAVDNSGIIPETGSLEDVVIAMGKGSYEANTRLILDLMSLHMDISNNGLTLEKAIQYINYQTRIYINTETLGMSINVMASRLPIDPLESLRLSSANAAATVWKNVVSDEVEIKLNNKFKTIGGAVLSKCVDLTYESVVSCLDVMNTLDNPAIGEWRRNVKNYYEKYNSIMIGK